MDELVWYFPTSLAEAVSLLQDGAVPHAGGTGILRTGTRNLRRLVDLRRLPLSYLNVSGGVVEMGAMLTFADVVKQMQRIDSSSVLIEALGRAGSTPLRNRITLGGSIAMAPPWSDLSGPLLALDADVVLLNETEAICPFAQILEDRTVRKGKLVKAVRFDLGHWQSSYVRASVTQFDYAAFTLTTLVRKNSGQEIEAARLVVTGNKARFRRLAAQERALLGRKAGDVDGLSQLAADAATDVEFTRKPAGSSEYLRHLFGVELERALEQAVRG